MPNILIIADDLTGAADCGAVLAERGLETVVLLGGAGSGVLNLAEFRGADVLAIDADTRCLDPEAAGEAVAQLVRAFDTAAGPDGNLALLFKKLDSTLRGNVAAEVAAALQGRRAGAPAGVAVLFAPAFPAQGRTTVNGRQMVHGQTLESCEHPRSEIAAILREANLSSTAIGLARVRGTAPALESAMHGAANEVDVVICDAETEEDLRAIASAAMVLHQRTVFAGSAGLARHIPEAVGLTRSSGSGREGVGALQVQGPSLFVVGSPAAASREQAHALAASPDVASVAFSEVAMLRGEQFPEWQRKASLIMEHIASGQDVLVQFDSAGSCSGEQGGKLARSLARMIAPCVDCVGALVATGGETARAILDAWSIQRLRLLGEVEPGVPYSLAQRANRDVLILTKAGGFGTPDTLLRCREFLCKMARRPAGLDGQIQAPGEKS
jgi:4-hydroxythreonine-4-phosphate dehydrogenase